MPRFRNCALIHKDVLDAYKFQYEYLPDEVSQCPLSLQMMDLRAAAYLQVYNAVKSFGGLPEAGGWFDQDAQTVHALLTIEHELKRIEDVKHKRAKRG